ARVANLTQSRRGVNAGEYRAINIGEEEDQQLHCWGADVSKRPRRQIRSCCALWCRENLLKRIQFATSCKRKRCYFPDTFIWVGKGGAQWIEHALIVIEAE